MPQLIDFRHFGTLRSLCKSILNKNNLALASASDHKTEALRVLELSFV
jgi:hypothetical protein